MGGRVWKEGKRLFKKLKRVGVGMNYVGQVMGQSGLKTGLNEKTFTAQVFIQNHRAVHPHTADHSSIKAPHHTYGPPLDLGKVASKSNLLTWAIRLVFPDPVTYVQRSVSQSKCSSRSINTCNMKAKSFLSILLTATFLATHSLMHAPLGH